MKRSSELAERPICPSNHESLFAGPALGVKGELQNVLESFPQQEAIVLSGRADLHSGLSVRRGKKFYLIHPAKKKSAKRGR
jgi:hypothetical protein